jgi:hypothetical protein
MMTIRFLRDTTLIINNSVKPSYRDTYNKDEIEHVDLISETESYITVQFNNGETSDIYRDAIVYITHAK